MADSKISQNGWVRVAQVRSESNAAKFYILGLRALKTGAVEFGCDCPSRIYRKGTKEHKGFAVTCKHIRSVLDGTVALSDLSLTTEGVVFFDALKVAEGTDNDKANKALAKAKAVGIALASNVAKVG